MTMTLDDRLTSIENDINRILEDLQELTTIVDASKHVKILDTEAKDICYRITSIEKRITSLKYKWQKAYNRSKS